MRTQRETQCAPTDIDIRMMIGRFGRGGDLADRLDAGEKIRCLHRAGDRVTLA